MHTTRRRLWASLLPIAAIAALFTAAPAGAVPSTQPSPYYPTCTYAWGNPAGFPDPGIYLGGSGNGAACTTQVSTFCQKGASAYWTGWVFLYVPASGSYNRDSNPCADGTWDTTAVYFRELYPFGRLCWGSAHNGFGQWQWNQDSFCNG
jgi:hypothetical protein